MTSIVFLDSATLPISIPRAANIVRWTDRPSTRERDIVSVLADADIAVTNKVPLRQETLMQLPKLKFICVAASGYDCIDTGYCRARNIHVSNVPGYASTSVAEHVIACIFMLRRQMVSYGKIAAGREWTESKVFCAHGARIHDIAGSTIGLIGTGAIGTEVARLAKALGMRVLLSERKGIESVRTGYVAFETVIHESDIISLHCPATPTTVGLIGEVELSKMKSTAVLINTARGVLVDERALENALLTGEIAGAALDVLQVEPPHEQHRFLTRQLENLLLTPHVAWASTHGIETLAEVVASNITSFLNGHTMNRVA
jgi:glycerate dehydrogenase